MEIAGLDNDEQTSPATRSATLANLACKQQKPSHMQLDGCIVWNAHNTVLGEEARLIYIVPVCYVKQVVMEKPSNIIISLHRKKMSIITNMPLIIS